MLSLCGRMGIRPVSTRVEEKLFLSELGVNLRRFFLSVPRYDFVIRVAKYYGCLLGAYLCVASIVDWSPSTTRLGTEPGFPACCGDLVLCVSSFYGYLEESFRITCPIALHSDEPLRWSSGP